MNKPARSFRVTATGAAFTADNANQELVMTGARLFGGSAASSAILREGSGAGRVLAELQCAIGAADECRIPITFKGVVHVTLAGAGAACTAYVA